MILLTICIATLEKRKYTLLNLRNHLESQIRQHGLQEQVEVIISTDRGELSTGTKRNLLYMQAQGLYVCSVDDDDWVPHYYVSEIIKAIETGPDAVSMNGNHTTNGGNLATWDISLHNAYVTGRKNGRTHYFRFHNHLSPIKKEIVLQFPFPEIYFGEDYAFAKAMHDAKAIKTEVKIELPMYEYRYQDKK